MDLPGLLLYRVVLSVCMTTLDYPCERDIDNVYPDF